MSEAWVKDAVKQWEDAHVPEGLGETRRAALEELLLEAKPAEGPGDLNVRDVSK